MAMIRKISQPNTVQASKTVRTVIRAAWRDFRDQAMITGRKYTLATISNVSRPLASTWFPLPFQ
jgi:hypothetical protein